MKPRKLLAFGLLLVGICLAAAFGSRNGPTHVEYRLAQGELALIAEELAEPDPGRVADLEKRQQVLSAVTLPKPMDRLAEWFGVGGVGWLAGVVLIIAGALLARKQQQAEMSGEGGLDRDAVDFQAALTEILERMDRLQELLQELPMDQDSEEARALIDGLFTDLVEPLVDQRGRFMARHGLSTFAEYFGAFAGGERNLARVWSAITDGHSEEARDALQRARGSFLQSEEAWRAAESSRG